MKQTLEGFEQRLEKDCAELENKLIDQGLVYNETLGVYVLTDQDKQAYFENWYRCFLNSLEEATIKLGESRIDKESN
jgi:hypothetical protein